MNDAYPTGLIAEGKNDSHLRVLNAVYMNVTCHPLEKL